MEKNEELKARVAIAILEVLAVAVPCLSYNCMMSQHVIGAWNHHQYQLLGEKLGIASEEYRSWYKDLNDCTDTVRILEKTLKYMIRLSKPSEK